MEPNNLTKRQAQTLDFLISFIAQHGYAPTVREISNEMYWSSSSTAHAVLEQLKRKGYISKEGGPRTIRILDKGRSAKVPDGFRKIEVSTVYFDPETLEFVVTGSPKDEEKHNCDGMGCSSVAHVIFRGYMASWTE